MPGPSANDQHHDGHQDYINGSYHSQDERQDQPNGSHLVKDIESLEDDAKDDGSDVDISCGVWKLRTNVLGTCYSNLYVFALCVGISAMFSTMVEVVIPVQLTSLEKQFQIDNAKAGLLTSSSKFGLLVSVLVAGHFTRKSNIPVVIGISGIIQGLLLMVPAVLQYTDPYELELVTKRDNTTNTTEGNSVYICASNGPLSNGTPLSDNTTSRPVTTKEVSQVAFVVVLVMQVLKGVTETFHSNFLPTVYMDDNVMDKTKMSLFMGITQMLTNLAQPLGTEVNGLLTEIPVDLKATDMDATDGRFVAAWWLAFLIFGVGTTLSSIPLILFPRQLVSKVRQQRALEEAAVTFAGGRFGDSQENQPTEQTSLLTQSVQEDSTSKYYTLTGTESGDSSSPHGSSGIPVNASAGCDCTWGKLLLVCGDDGNNYQSPCYAGCTGVDGKVFTGCTGLTHVTNTSIVTPGLCATDCYTNFLIYTGLHGVQYLVEGASLIPRNLLILRLVDPRDRAFAISFFMFFSYVISVPSPNVFGTIIDDMCLIWDRDLCLLYDRDQIRYLLSGVDVGISLAVALNLFLIQLILMWENKKHRLKLQMDEIGKENAIYTAGTERRNSLQ